MKSFLAILLCAFCACGAFGLFLYQSGSGKLAGILGKPPITEGTPLFPINKKAISKIEIKIGDNPAQTYQRRYSFWSTVLDGEVVRADYSNLESILYLISTAKVIQPLSAPPKDAGEPIELTFASDTGEYFSTTLICQLPLYTGVEEPLSPAFVLQFQDGRYYSCTSDLTENYPRLEHESLIDHKPFFFHKGLIREFTYRHEGQIFTVSRTLPNTEWKITQPISLRTDEKEVNKVIDALYDLKAHKLSEKPLTIKEGTPSFTIKSFSTEIPTQSLLLPSHEEGFLKTQPFSYHLAPESLKAATPSIDVIRSKTLSGAFVKRVQGQEKLDIGKISSILLQSSEQKSPVSLAILKSKSGFPRWNYNISGTWRPANEIGISNLLTALTQDRVEGFSLETISSSLQAERSVTIQFKDGTQQHFDLFRDKEKRILVQEKGVDYSAIINSTHAQKIETDPTGWKDNVFWDLSSITLKGLHRHIKGKLVETYGYNFNLEKWNGQIDGKDITEDLDIVAANALLNILETLHVDRWIPADTAESRIGDSPPVASIIAISEIYDDLGDVAGLIKIRFPVSTPLVYLVELLLVN